MRAYPVFGEDSPYHGWTMSVIGPQAPRLSEIEVSTVAPWAENVEDRWRPWRARTFVRPGLSGYTLAAAALHGGPAQWAAALDWLAGEPVAVVAPAAPALAERRGRCRRHRERLLPAGLAAQTRPGHLVLMCPRVGCDFTRGVSGRGNP